MAKLIIKIDTDNSAFDHNEGSEVARILRKIADQVDQDSANQILCVKDINGNTVGSFDYYEDV